MPLETLFTLQDERGRDLVGDVLRVVVGEVGRQVVVAELQ